MAIFYRQEKETPALRNESKEIKESTQWRLDALLDELNKEKDAEQRKKIKEEILGIKRELNRSKQFGEVTLKKPAEWKNSLDTISASNLLRLDKEVSTEKRGEFLSKSFLYKRSTDSEGTIIEEPVETGKITQWDTLFVDFGKNKSANMRIWLWHMLGVDVGYVEIDWKIWVRSIINWRVGYYTKPSPDGYIPVFTGTVVTIPVASKIWDFEKTKDSKLQKNTNQEESNKANDLYIEKLERIPESSNIEVSTLMRESYDFWKQKDPSLTEEQISWLLANEYQESRCNPHANNNNISFGIFQWKRDRIEKIKTATWIDIMVANHTQQLEAAWWEMTQDSFEKKVYPLLKQAKTPSEAAAIFVTEFERPADKTWEPVLRWKIAENIYHQFRFINNPELANLPEWEANKKILEFSLVALNWSNSLWALECTDWVDKVYKQTIWKSVFHTKLVYNWIAQDKLIDENGKQKGTGYHGIHASSGEINLIMPGNHLMVDHKENGIFSQWRTHSVIALWRPIDWIVEVVSFPNYNGRPPVKEKYDLYWQNRAEKDGRVLRINAA